MIGKELLHYYIEAQLGAGGMGEVFQARDTKLGRALAVKILPEIFARDPERVSRFELANMIDVECAAKSLCGQSIRRAGDQPPRSLPGNGRWSSSANTSDRLTIKI